VSIKSECNNNWNHLFFSTKSFELPIENFYSIIITVTVLSLDLQSGTDNFQDHLIEAQEF